MSAAVSTLSGPRQIADSARGTVPAPVARPIFRERRCPECGAAFSPAVYNQLFCASPHKLLFERRLAKRGFKLTALAMAARQTRDGTRGDVETGRWAARETRRLLQLWADDDREAGRPSAVEYVSLRKRLGLHD
ncbi:MAG: hypothetical protein INF91_04205 [Alphaproteobacteria bacterium]|nr:hypothetical protein [Alphaproteobacteria bacterium]